MLFQIIAKIKQKLILEDDNLWKSIVEPFLLQTLDKEKLNISRKKSHILEKKAKVRFVSILNKKICISN